MAVTRARINVRLKGLERLRASLSKPTPAVQAAFVRVESIYAQFIAARFDKFSKGGGNWRKIKPATALAKGSTLILINRRDFRRWLPGGIRMRILKSTHKYRFMAGFKAGTNHPRARMPMSKLGAIHDRGQGVNPKRQILTGIDETTRKRIRAVLIAAIKKR